MKVVVVKDFNEVGKEAFKVIKEVVTAKNDAVLGCATGSSPISLYENWIKDHKENGTSYANCTTFNLDEYCDIDPKHPESYVSFMHKNLFDHIDLKPESINMPSGNSEADCVAYENKVKNTVVDVQILGIGSNGHIGFNEPNTPFTEETHIVELTENTRKDNARFFENDINLVPTHAISMGIATIMRAKKIVLVANGANKADAIAAMVNGPVDPICPASVLQNHPDVTVVVDEAAASKL